MTAPPAPSPAEVYPIRQARFANGRTWHRIKTPDTWHDLLHAACGKSGYLASGHPMNGVRECGGCAKVIEGHDEGARAS